MEGLLLGLYIYAGICYALVIVMQLGIMMVSRHGLSYTYRMNDLVKLIFAPLTVPMAIILVALDK